MVGGGGAEEAGRSYGVRGDGAEGAEGVVKGEAEGEAEGGHGVYFFGGCCWRTSRGGF